MYSSGIRRLCGHEKAKNEKIQFVFAEIFSGTQYNLLQQYGTE
jgi:hypothetical protein